MHCLIGAGLILATRESILDFVPVSWESSEDDVFTMQAGSSEARDPQRDLVFWLTSLQLTQADAQSWAEKELSAMEILGSCLGVYVT